MNIRSYKPEDWQRLCEIHDSSRLDELRLTVGTEAFLSLQQTAETEGLFEGRLDVAELNGLVVGFVAYDDEELTWLYVDPLYYRKGVGRNLLRHAIANAGPVFHSNVLEGNRPALQLYLSEGFIVVERMEGRLVGNEAFPASGYLLKRRKE
ncbi:GNAT family N-acetyltransferase [Brevibacillus humidisoli]|uniref:GNAT family N-acetyltransferase n=1 Tax=Brevibacillus humidisoli TaxID=2895522 RepID=UPI001E31859D|nr:GNAT family N-acetyltransferase [Brevibacillus humidisoli]UFJ39080.1 GNAT family N-acetyltransferase [Brevibacillus humidisoli]